MKSFDIVIETPRDSKEKYNMHPGTKEISFKKPLPLGMVFPHDFGFIPATKGEDGDPLDALVISEFKTFPGCHIDCRLIGVLAAEQEETKKKVRNDRYFFIPNVSMQYQRVKRIADFPKDYIEQLVFFFVAYNQAEGKIFTPLKFHGAEKARDMILKASSKPPAK